MSEQDQIAADEADLERQIRMTKELVGSADKILLATATAVNQDENIATFEVMEALAGQSDSEFSATWDGSRVTVGCGASYGFYNVFLGEGQTYLLYIKAGQIRRASENQPERWGMGFIHELLLVRNEISPNK
jgi:hypothetical protein